MKRLRSCAVATITLASLLGLGGLGPSSVLATTFDVSADFSIAGNPSRAWSYGAETTLGSSSIILFSNGFTAGSGLRGGDTAAGVTNSLGAPGLALNPTAAVITLPGIATFAPGATSFHPGPDSLTVFRFTALRPEPVARVNGELEPQAYGGRFMRQRMTISRRIR